MNKKPEPIGKEWLSELRRLFAEEFPEPSCPAQRAVEGVGEARVDTNRFVEEEEP
jgi:hypothetical protein